MKLTWLTTDLCNIKMIIRTVSPMLLASVIESESLVSTTHHVILILKKDGEFFKERNHQDKQLLIITFKNFDQQANNVFIPHLQFCPRILSKVQQEVKRH